MSKPALSLLQYLRITAAALHADTRTDAELLSRYAQAHEETAFAALVVRHGPLVWRVCCQILGHSHDVEEAFQSVFLALSRQAGKIQIETLAGWLHQVARRAALDLRKSADSRRRLQEQLQAMARSEVPHPYSAERNEIYEMLHDELAELTEKLRVPLVLHYLEGKTQVEVAQILGVSERAVRKRLQRGKARLQERLTQRGISAGAVTLAALLEESAAKAAISIDLVRRTVGAALAFRVGTLSGTTAELARQVLQSLPYGMGWMVKTCLVAFLCAGGLGAGVYVWRASTLSLPRVAADGPTTATVKEGASQQGDKDKASQVRLDVYGDPLPPGALARLGTVRFRPHWGDLLAFTQDGKKLITGQSNSWDTCISVWDRDTGQLLRQLGDFRNFCGASIAANGGIVAGWHAVRPNQTPGTPEDLLYLWETATGKLLRTFRGSSSERCYAISPDGQLLATDLGGEFGVWEIATGKQLWGRKLKQTHISAVAFSSDSSMVATGILNNKGEIHLWEVRTGRLLNVWKNDSEERGVVCKHIDFSIDGGRLLVHSQGWQEKGGHPRRVYLCEVTTGKMQFLGEDESEMVLYSSGAIVATRNRRTGNNTIWLWDMVTGKKLRRFSGIIGHVLALSPDRQILACATKEKGIGLWDMATGKEVRYCQKSWENPRVLAFSPDGKILVGTHSTALIFWEVASGKKLPQPREYQGPVDAVAFAPNGKLLVSIEGSRACGTAHIWDPQSAQERLSFPSATMPVSSHILGTGFTPDGQVLAAGLDSVVSDKKSKYIDIWEIVSGQKLQRLEMPLEDDKFTRGFIFSPNSRLLACNNTMQHVKEKNEVFVWDLATGKRLHHRFRGWRPVFSPDGTLLATQDSEGDRGNVGSVCYLWEIATGKKIADIKVAHPYFVTLVFSTNGQALLVSNCVYHDKGYNMMIKLYPLHRDKQVGVARTIPDINDQVLVVAYSFDGKMLASANDLGTISLWEIDTGKERVRFMGHKDRIESLSFSPDGRRLASGSGDTTILVWDVTGRLDDQGRLRPVRLSAKQMEERWANLASPDAARANQSIWTLVAAGQPTVAFLEKRLYPVPSVAAATLTQLVTDLDSETFAVRQKARQQLEALGDVAEPSLRQASEKRPSLELRRSVDHLLALVEEQRARPSGETLRVLRAIEVLERMGTPEARKLLEVLSSGAPGARQSKEAQASLSRLVRRAPQP